MTGRAVRVLSSTTAVAHLTLKYQATISCTVREVLPSASVAVKNKEAAVFGTLRGASGFPIQT